jgi:hypothetical protein
LGDRVVIVDWFRADNSRRMRRVLLIGASSMLVGGLVIAVSFLTRQPEHVREVSAGVGIVLVAGSALFTTLGMHAILRDDVAIVLRTDGVVVQSGAVETAVPWADLASARWDDARQELVLERRGAPALVLGWRPARISGTDLAARIGREQQKEAMGLLR